jgi:hypothetical protein
MLLASGEVILASASTSWESGESECRRVIVLSVVDVGLAEVHNERKDAGGTQPSAPFMKLRSTVS